VRAMADAIADYGAYPLDLGGDDDRA
jgi:hypothetical protein